MGVTPFSLKNQICFNKFTWLNAFLTKLFKFLVVGFREEDDCLCERDHNKIFIYFEWY